MPKRIKRLILDQFRPVRLQAGDLVHREDFHGHWAARIRNHRIFVALLVELNRLGGLREQVDHRAAAQAEGGWRDTGIQALAALLAFEAREQQDHLDAALESGGASLAQTVQVHEEELVGKREIFLQQPVAD